MNKISTLGYFKKRLRDNGFIVIDLFKNYSSSDKRKWTIMINPGVESIHITCSISDEFDTPVFEISDDGQKIRLKHVQIATASMEVVISRLLDWGVVNNNKTSPYFKEH